MSFLGNIDFNSLSDTERVIYDYLTGNVEKIPYMRIREIANESHVSSSSVMRLVRKLGFDSFAEFKLSFKEELNNSSQHNGEIFLIKDIFPINLEENIAALAKKIVTCENVVFFGIGSSGALCDYGMRKLAILGYNTFSLTDPTFPIGSKLKNTTDNIIIVLSVSGNTSEIIELINGYTENKDYYIVSITSDASSKLAMLSDLVLHYKVSKWYLHLHEDLTSQIPGMYIIERITQVLYALSRE